MTHNVSNVSISHNHTNLFGTDRLLLSCWPALHSLSYKIKDQSHHSHDIIHLSSSWFRILQKHAQTLDNRYNNLLTSFEPDVLFGASLIFPEGPFGSINTPASVPLVIARFSWDRLTPDI